MGGLILESNILSSNKKKPPLKKRGINKKIPHRTRAQISEESSKLKKRAIDLYLNDYMVTSIAKNLGVTAPTVHKWLSKAGVRRPKGDCFTSIADENAPPVDPLADTLEEDLKLKSTEAVKLALHDAVLEEDKSLLEIAESQSSPADKYQHYVAATGIKLMRDSMKNLRGPRTVRELSELDQLIRRNLGLNSKNGGGSSKMQIDISILNNTEADRGNGAVRIQKPKVIDVPPTEQEQEQDND